MNRSCCVLLALLALAPSAHAQLRPVDPLDWRPLETLAPVHAELGVGRLSGQNASLAGTTGLLYELGSYRLAVRTGRVVLGVAGTLLRRFEDQDVVRPPASGVASPNGEPRQQVGGALVSTAVRLIGTDTAPALVLRFGTALPTAGEERGLDRDRTDFFVTVAGRYRRGSFTLRGETGLGIHGTRLATFEQSDAWMYALSVEHGLGPVTSTAIVLGHYAGSGPQVRGNEDLSEARLGVRVGERIWVQALAVRGIARFSPSGGFLLTLGMRP
jgi:hypothetical protein